MHDLQYTPSNDSIINLYAHLNFADWWMDRLSDMTVSVSE